MTGGLAAAGCGDNFGDVRPPDAGPTPPAPDAATPAPDAGTPGPDAGGVTACEAPLALTGTLGMVMITGDTSADTLPEPLDLGSDCGPLSDTRPPQQVVAYTVPGTEQVGLDFSLVNDGTPASFDTLVQIRTACDTAPDDDDGTCFDDSVGAESRSRGSLLANGGETVYFVITGNAEPAPGRVSEGAWRLEVQASATSAPVLTQASVRIRQTYLEGTFTGTDTSSDVREVRIVALDEQGNIIDVNFNGVGDERDQLRFRLDGTDGQAAFTGTFQEDAFGLFLLDMGAVAANVSLRDRFGDESNSVRVDIDIPELRGVGESCDGVDEFCPIDLACESNTCTVSQAVNDACAAATPIAIATPTTTRTTAQVTATLQPGTSRFTAICVETTDAEALLTVDVPAGGTYDLIAHTDRPETGDFDTILYARSSCQDPTTEADCSDDSPGIAPHSRVEIRAAAAGTYTLVVEGYPFLFQPLPAEIGLEVALRPVLDSGAACDVAEVDNRCAAGACATGTCP